MQKFNPHYPGFGNKSHQVGSPICYAQCTFLVFIITLEMEGRPKRGEIISEVAFLFLQDIDLMLILKGEQKKSTQMFLSLEAIS